MVDGPPGTTFKVLTLQDMADWPDPLTEGRTLIGQRGSTRMDDDKAEPVAQEPAPEDQGETEVAAVKKAKARAAKKEAAPKKVRAATNGNGGEPRGAKTKEIARLLQRKNGCTAAEVLEATGWPAVSMPAMAKACGLKLKKEKVKGERTRYFGE